MSIREIIKIPNPFLKLTAEPVKIIDQSILKLMDDMLETMYKANGIGLAANQIAENKRIIVMDCGNSALNEETKDANEKFIPHPLKMINPKIKFKSSTISEREEGCLSIPGYNAVIKRPNYIIVEYTDENQNKLTLNANNLLATCIQHEIDHLDGILFIDHLSKLKKDMIFKKAIKEYSINV